MGRNAPPAAASEKLPTGGCRGFELLPSPVPPVPGQPADAARRAGPGRGIFLPRRQTAAGATRGHAVVSAVDCAGTRKTKKSKNPKIKESSNGKRLKSKRRHRIAGTSLWLFSFWPFGISLFFGCFGFGFSL